MQMHIAADTWPESWVAEMKKAKFTFKRVPPPAGLAGIGWLDCTNIKFNKLCRGWIQQLNTGIYEVWFHLEDRNAKCGWRNAKLKNRFSSEDEARNWINENATAIQKLNLHFMAE